MDILSGEKNLVIQNILVDNPQRNSSKITTYLKEGPNKFIFAEGCNAVGKTEKFLLSVQNLLNTITTSTSQKTGNSL